MNPSLNYNITIVNVSGTFVNPPDSPEVLAVQVRVGHELGGGDAGVVDSGQLPAHSGLHAVGVVDANYLGEAFNKKVSILFMFFFGFEKIQKIITNAGRWSWSFL